jgi:hypothetical protein
MVNVGALARADSCDTALHGDLAPDEPARCTCSTVCSGLYPKSLRSRSISDWRVEGTSFLITSSAMSSAVIAQMSHLSPRCGSVSSETHSWCRRTFLQREDSHETEVEHAPIRIEVESSRVSRPSELKARADTGRLLMRWTAWFVNAHNRDGFPDEINRPVLGPFPALRRESTFDLLHFCDTRKKTRQGIC